MKYKKMKECIINKITIISIYTMFFIAFGQLYCKREREREKEIVREKDKTERQRERDR